ncbi:hypothetical protein [Leucothrix arctica]|uniref:Autotransporter domain-containing protein n=1 Tax=Leucothrix arctica TaxID=1481894 RepID=A0A317CII8_9GAMM|nr:hypothetical protein [Leucothrix arctica]PWQ98375.1 hypothetical protein DKT75_04410 [Leucothrix arctica]
MLLRRSCALNITLRQSLLSLSVFVCSTVSVTAQEPPQLPILEKAKVLHCVQSEGAAKEALGAFWEIQDETDNFPDEHLLKNETHSLHAATLDILLNTLVNTAQRYPALRTQVERTMLQWNYCDVMQEGVLFDIKSDGIGVSRALAPENSPINWEGFKSLGFFGEVEGRFIPELISFDQQSLRVDFEWLFHRIYRQQCFPHPDTSGLFDRFENNLNKKVIAQSEVAEATEYTYSWDSECIYPVSVPELKAQVKVEPLLDIPLLKTQLKIIEIPLVIPQLNTTVLLSPIPVTVPLLKTELLIIPTEILVPLLKTTVLIVPVEIDIPVLETSVVIIPIEILIPILQTAVEVEEQPAVIPKLLTKLVIDKPKVKVVVYNGIGLDGIQTHSHGLTSGSGGTGFGSSRPAPTHKHRPGDVHGPGIPVAHKVIAASRVAPAVVVRRPQAVQAIPVAAQPQKMIIVDKNQPLLERLLGGLAAGSNVLIVDNIQLTVNEYNGSVETVISNSNIGTLESVLPAKLPVAAPAAEAKQFVKSNFVPTITSTPQVTVQPKPVVNVQVAAKPQPVVRVKPLVVTKPVSTKQTAAKKILNELLAVPMVESMVFVNEPMSRTMLKPVVIKKQVRDLLAVPRLQTQIKLTAIQASKSRNRTKAKAKRTPQKKQSSDVSSSLFIYSPYENGDKPKSGEKTVEQLLQEYAEYEENLAARKAGKRPKKKQIINKPVESYKPDSQPVIKKIEARLKASVKTQVSQEVDVARLNTQIFVGKRSQVSLPKEQMLSTSQNYKNSTKPATFIFSEKSADARDIAQFSAPAANIPVGLGADAPAPYFIDETFVEELPSDVVKKGKRKPIGLAGGVYLKKSLANSKWAIGGSVNRKLIKDDYWFARGGWNYSLENEEDPFSYSWGIGYSDWHPGTFSAQLNNWGPLKLGDGLALDKAVASFGYSVKSEILKKYRLSLSGALNIPIDGNSSAAANFRWSPKENWYISSSLSYPLEGDGDPKWTYGFGYSDWRPNKFNLQYSNYGPNDLFEPNYKENGTWSFSYNWKF